ncbi:hypothetical protein [Polymorphobacter fuscus]|uniref:Uncharacterized protein n=1 Tax=Sandarakinorhabdus fusca TaxID=1439888 RepID=A0A7C9KIM3_9SPHN|nr:hypothetical protein [Polymorphobacter fuscus]KAB7646247.1 hypothetical protein F9290_09320 [Polymorphobacter fuscus]MQT17461.1 hypothetical protein [Polymorphobacter fuscus]NJC10002.1 hypothetical protein [Polymorphobacter fuscus]
MTATLPVDHANSDQFVHIRVLIGVILGLSIGKLLQGFANLAEHPYRRRIWWVHLGWTLWALLSVVGFWWWEYGLSHLRDWTFATYLFVFGYAACYFMICALLFPADMAEWPGYDDYFLARRRWFFGLVAFTAILDIGDGQIKGAAYVSGLGLPYLLQTGILLAICAIGAFSARRNVQAGLLLVALGGRLLFFFTTYYRLG